MSSLKQLNQPSSDHIQNQYLDKLRGLFFKPSGEESFPSLLPKNQMQKQQSSKIKDKKQLIFIRSPIEKNAQGVVLKQIASFHEHYEGKIGELRMQIQNLKETVKIIRYELEEKDRKLVDAETRMEISLKENEELLKIIQSKRLQNQKRNDKADIHTFYQSLNESHKEKLLTLQRRHTEELQSLRSKIHNILIEKQQSIRIIDKLTQQNSAMRLSIREYQIEKKYENQRIKNATLELNIRLKNQEQMIFNLRKQQSKEFYSKNNTCRLSEIEKRDTMNDSVGGGVLVSDPNCQSVLSGSILNEFKITSKKVANLNQGQWGRERKELPVFVSEKEKEKEIEKEIKQKEREKQKQIMRYKEKDRNRENLKQSSKKSRCKQLTSQVTHKRNLSYHHNLVVDSFLREEEQEKLKTARQTHSKGNSELKIKVMRLEKMKKK